MSIIESSREQSHPFFKIENLPSGFRERASQYLSDPREHKLDLGAGVLRDDSGAVWSFKAVGDSLETLYKSALGKGYPPALGNVAFCEQMRRLILGDAAAQASDRSFSIQTIGAAQATRLIADCLKRLNICDTISISRESWADHRRIFERAGFTVETHPYLSSDGQSIDFAALTESLKSMKPGSAVLLQIGCHNPTGRTLELSEWQKVLTLCKERSILPILDAAYIGFGRGIEEDLAPIRECVKQGIDVLIATSCCKMFSLYESRVGAITAVVSNSEIAEKLRSQFRIEIQANHSSSPQLFAEVIAMVLNYPELKSAWANELQDARELIQQRRQKLAAELTRLGASPKLQSIISQEGIFAWTGLDRSQATRLTRDFAIYCPSNGRLCLAALPTDRIPYVAQALHAVECDGE